MAGFIGVADAAREIGVSEQVMRRRAKYGSIPYARKIGCRWFVPEPYSLEPEVAESAPMLVNGMQAAAELGLTRERVRQLCEDGLIAGAERRSGIWLIPSPVIRLPDLRPRWQRKRIEDGMVSLSEAAVELGCTEQHVRRLCGKGRIKGAQKQTHGWRIPTPVKRVKRE